MFLRHLLPAAVAALVTTSASAQLRSIDGSGNNPAHPDFGQAGSALLRKTTVSYGDGLSSPAGQTRRSPRAISNVLLAQGAPIPNEVKASDFVWQWGQFLDHDMDLTEGAAPAEAFDIPVPQGDPFFDPLGTGTQVIGLTRSEYVVDGFGVRQQRNAITAWIDASNVYGSDPVRALELRRLDGSGMLKTSPGGLLPFNVNGLPNAGGPGPELFLAGDVRANEQLGLTAMHTLFVREHNHWAASLASIPWLTDEGRYQLARSIVAAEMQAITYNEFLPVLLGPGALAPYAGHDPEVDPGIANAFSTACYRVGHTMLSATLLRLDENLEEIPAGHISLASSFFNPTEIVTNGIEPILRGLAHQRAQRVDTRIVDPVRNFLFGPPGAGGFDLGSLNIQRGRDHGLPGYNQMRMDYGLPAKANFFQVTSDPVLAAALDAVYGNVNAIDAWVGALAEDHLPGAMVGELVATVLADQFERLRDGDPFWYESTMSPVMVRFVERQTLARIIRRNTSIGREVPLDAFHARANGAHLAE